MKKNKLNHQQMGEILSKGRSMVGYYANGKSQPDLDTLSKIANYFETSIDDLLRTDMSKPKKFYTIGDKGASDSNIMYGNPENEIAHLRDKVSMLEKQIQSLNDHISTQNLLIRELRRSKKQ